ncbi:hypothetical protein, conserved in T. vivax, partial [Trypanosoma vivax Y486]
MEEAQERQGRIAEKCSHATGSEAHLATEQEANATERLTLIATRMCRGLTKVGNLTRRATNAAGKLSGHSTALAGEIDQWVSTMSSVVSKAKQGKFCLGESSRKTEGASELQESLDKGLKKAQDIYPDGDAGRKTVPKRECGTNLAATIQAGKGDNLKSIRRKLAHSNVTQLLETDNTHDTAKSDPASTCPLTSIAQNNNAGIYRGHTVAGMWTITSTETGQLVATYRPEKMETIKAIAAELEGVSTETENEKWIEQCTIGGTNWCTVEVER